MNFDIAVSVCDDDSSPECDFCFFALGGEDEGETIPAFAGTQSLLVCCFPNNIEFAPIADACS